MEFIFLLMSLFGFTEAEAIEVIENEPTIEIPADGNAEASIVILPGAPNNRK
ncbi:MAG: hypothetical protein NWQ19_00685 [Nonlabens sp.]|nr:hypothetical protein [Nonlabens sp.]